MKTYKLNLFLFFLILMCIACGRKGHKVTVFNNKEPNVIGKRIVCVDSIIGDEGKEKVIFLFNEYDCGTCVDSGFQMTKNIDRLWKGKRVFVISTMVNSPFYQKRNNYYDYIYSDEKDLIRKELKYIQTPVLLFVDTSSIIKKVVYPNFTPLRECQEFMYTVTSTQ